MESRYKKYLEYITKTGGSPKVEWFDEDWEPIGPGIRARMEIEGLIYEKDGCLYLTEPTPQKG